MADPSSDSDPQSPTRHHIYNPYQDLNLNIRRQLYDIPTSPEFLFQEESTVQRRSVTENLTYYTGTSYLAGALAGGALGLKCGLAEAERGDSLKIRANRVLNSSGHHGRRIGNRLGVIGLIYAGLESGVAAWREEDDWKNAVAAGLGTGVVFRAANGVRSAAVAGAVGGVLVWGDDGCKASA